MAWFEGRRERDARGATIAQRTIGVDSVQTPSGPDGLHEQNAPSQTGSVEGVGRNQLVQFSLGRGGRYAVTDASGHQIGAIYGDYVIGFTVTCWDTQWTFNNLDDAKTALQLEAQAREHAGQRAAS